MVVPYRNLTAAFLYDFCNRFVNEAFPSTDVPILRILSPTSSEWKGHVIQLPCNDIPGFDCSHFSQPYGVFYHWRELLFNAFSLLPNETEGLDRNANFAFYL